MVNRFLMLIAITAVLIQFVVLQRTSDLKCAEYSQIPRSSYALIQPHIVWIAEKNNNNFSQFGILVSERFVMTTALAVFRFTVAEIQVYFPPVEIHSIAEKIIHPNYIDQNNHNIALLRLESSITLDSQHRPACFWTRIYYESLKAETLALCRTCLGFYETKSVNIINGKKCSSLINVFNGNASSHICVQRDNPEDNRFLHTEGPPVQMYHPEKSLPDNYFIYGLTSYVLQTTDPNTAIVLKLNNHLDWIETTVWPLLSDNSATHRDDVISDLTCGHIQPNLQPFISFSTTTVYGEFPWHATIYQLKQKGDRSFICGGSLLNENTVLTAAHCVSFGSAIVSPTLLAVALGKYDLDILNKESRESLVNRVIPHEMFTQQFLDNDIAILKLKTIIQFSNFIQPICITHDSGIFSDVVGITAGWGLNEYGVEETLLKKGSFPIKTDSDCRKSNRNVFPMYLNGRNFCAGYQNGTSTCSGDSGGGLVFEHNKQWYVRGVVSVGVLLPDQNKCDITQLVVFTNVTKYYDWIRDKL